MADEKFVATQGNGRNKVMVKSCVVFDGLRNTASKGTEYTGKYSYSNFESTEDFWMEVYDIVSQRYDLEKTTDHIHYGRWSTLDKKTEHNSLRIHHSP